MSEKFSNQFRSELPNLWRFALRMSGDSEHAEELVQKTILRGLEKQHQYTPETNLRGWLYSIMHSIWKNELRAQAIRKNVSFHTDLIEQQPTNTSTAEENIFFKEVVNQINQLPEAQRIVILLICVEGYSYQENSPLFVFRLLNQGNQIQEL